MPGSLVARLKICSNFSAKTDIELHNKENYVIYLGRLSPEKGIRTLIAGAKLLRNVCVKIAGTGPLEAEVRRAVSKLSNVDYVGYVDGRQKDNLIRKARAMIVPSEWY